MNFRKGVYYFIIFISTLIIIASLLSLFYNLPYWYSKLLDFPRLQYLIVGIICLIIFIFLTKKWKASAIALAIGLLAAISIQSVRILPYWFGEKKVKDAVENYSEDNTVSVLLANVLMKNRKSEQIINIVKETDPDLIIAMEVNQWWLDELETFKEDYPHVIEQGNDEAYGMVIYSKFPLKNPEIKYLKHKNVPSFHSTVELKSGKEFVLHAVHPVAPMPSDKYPDNVGEAEIELIRVGDFVANDELPSMVAGDFNDVSWSNTARLFEESGELNNVRLGRGLYNTFDANSFIMRWPLDHYFVTQEFQVIEMKLLNKFGSDHFPLYTKFLLKD